MRRGLRGWRSVVAWVAEAPDVRAVTTLPGQAIVGIAFDRVQRSVVVDGLDEARVVADIWVVPSEDHRRTDTRNLVKGSGIAECPLEKRHVCPPLGRGGARESNVALTVV